MSKKKKSTTATDVAQAQEDYWNYWNEDDVEQDPRAAAPQDFTDTTGFYEGLMLPAEFANRDENEEDAKITDKKQLSFGHLVADELRKEFTTVQNRTHNFTFMEVVEGKYANRNLRRRINLEHCKLKGEMPSFDGPEFHAAGKLRVLTLMDNNIIGRMPSFDMFAHMHTLNLSFNNLNGPIPDMQKCPKLKYCYLNNNKFDGKPPSFQACMRLSELWVHCNCLSGVNEWRDDSSNLYDPIGVSLVCSKQYPHLAMGASQKVKEEGKTRAHSKKRAAHNAGRELFRASLAQHRDNK